MSNKSYETAHSIHVGVIGNGATNYIDTDEIHVEGLEEPVENVSEVLSVTSSQKSWHKAWHKSMHDEGSDSYRVQDVAQAKPSSPTRKPVMKRHSLDPNDLWIENIKIAPFWDSKKSLSFQDGRYSDRRQLLLMSNPLRNALCVLSARIAK